MTGKRGMKYPAALFAALLTFAIGTRAIAQTQAPAWVQHAWSDDNGDIRPYDLEVGLAGVAVTGFAFRAPNFDGEILPDHGETGTAAFNVLYAYDGTQAWVRRGLFQNLHYEPSGYHVVQSPEHVYTSEGYSFVFDAGMYAVGGVSVNKYAATGDSIWSVPVGSFKDRRIEDQPAFVKGLGIDHDGRTYIAGTYRDTLVLGGDTLVSAPFYADGDPSVDLFIASLDADGSFRWSESISSDKTESLGHPLWHDGNFAVTPDGHAYVGGQFGDGAMFGPGQAGENRLTRIAAGVARYDTDGIFEWLRLAEDDLGIVGDYEAAVIRGLAVGADGRLLVAWTFKQDGIDDRSVTVGDTTLTDPGFGGAFVTLYSPDGALQWVRQLRSAGNENVFDVAIGPDGSAFVAGSFDALELHLEEEVLRKNDVQEDREDGFVARYSADGQLLWTLHVAGPGPDRVNTIDVDEGGNLHVAAEFEEEVRFGTGSLTAQGGFDMFVARFDAATITSAEKDQPEIEVGASVQAYPNPFDKKTTIRFEMSAPGRVGLIVYDILGREVAVLADEWRPAGVHEAEFEPTISASGYYTYRLNVNGRSETGAIIQQR